ncbi:c-type cytochrome [Desulfopila inferna]|uniref:c-type cytochrome n=1 Tax=Desulfopila inferna TaxID=468528 RepID=UPI0019648226|nr:cytochrome c [Desulfopila inferna]MBM9603678.1 cytochrome c [Desulfopila inferna]
MKFIFSLIFTVILLAAAALVFAWTGVYNIAATKPHTGVISYYIEMLRDRSIAKRSEDVRVPDLGDARIRSAAFSHYHGMCRLCHGAPGYQAEEFAEDLYPAPPDMISGHIQEERSPSEIYWIVNHGIKMTGMPAFGRTHSDSELYGVAALALEIPQISSEEYRQQVEKIEGKNGGGYGGENHSTQEAAEHNH